MKSRVPVRVLGFGIAILVLAGPGEARAGCFEQAVGLIGDTYGKP